MSTKSYKIPNRSFHDNYYCIDQVVPRFAMGPFVAQGLAAFIVNLSTMGAGMIFGWASPSLPKLLETRTDNDDEELRLTSDQGSWVVSITSFGCIFGPILISLVVDRIGRKLSLNIIVFPMLISWLIIGLAKNVETLYIGRFIGGLGLGAVYALIPMYLGEIAEDKIRGALGTLMSTVLNCGMLLSFSTGPWISRQMLSIVSAIPPLMFLILFLWMPETPYFLLMRGCRDKALASLIWLRRRSNVNEELSSLEIIVRENEKNRDGFGIARLLRSSSNRRAFGISLGLLTFQQLSGVIAIQSYASLIFDDSGLTGWSSFSVIIMGVVKLFAGISVIFVVDAAGRRPILMISSLFTSLFLACEAVFFHVKYLGYDTSSVSWIPLLGIIGFYLFCVPGLSCIPYTMIGELFPTNVKASATMLLSSYGSMMGLIVAKLYEVAGSAIGTHWVFYLFASTTLIAVPYVYFFVPETKKLSLEDIQKNLKSRTLDGSRSVLTHDT